NHRGLSVSRRAVRRCGRNCAQAGAINEYRLARNGPMSRIGQLKIGVQNHSEISPGGVVVDNAGLCRENWHGDGSAGGSVVYHRDLCSWSTGYLPGNLKMDLLLAVDVIDG